MKTVLFDLDGTLLPMDMKEFTNGYFRYLTAKMAPHGYDAKELVDAIWKGTYAMVKNNGEKTNEEVFWDCFRSIYGEKGVADACYFNEFYDGEFNEAKRFCGFNPLANEIIRALKEKGVRVILATNPLFPIFAQKHRLNWAGVDPEAFDYISSYENSHYCKPNPAYFKELTDVLHLDPKECVMVGNDAQEDGAAKKAGIELFLLTDCLINEKNLDISGVSQGGFDDLRVWFEKNGIL